jgi:hypothetical protein
MSNLNPYAAPQAPMEPRPTGQAGGLAEGACPRCQSPNVNRPTYTWWGGLLGPKLFNHAVCSACGFGFNYKTGKSNATAIGIYLGVSVLIALALVAVYASVR